MTAEAGTARQATPARRRAWLRIGTGLVILAAAVILLAPALFRTGREPVDLTTRFLLAVSVILLVSHLFGEVLRRLRQPPVLGEILGGLVLGPSVLGLVWPEAAAWLFPAGVVESLDKAAQLGLVVFMFLLGCELRTDRIRNRGAVGAVVVGGMGLPFVAGVGIALAAAPVLAGDRATTTMYALFVGLALAITALPVLARILLDLGQDRTGVGVLSISSAAIGDGLAWLVLTFILASTGDGDESGLEVAALAVALVLVTYLCVRPALAVLVRRMRSEQLLTVVLVAGAIGFSALTTTIHLHPVIGAFLFGTAVPRGSPTIDRISHRLQGFTLLILLPLFFAGVGLQTSIGLLGGDAGHWLLFAGILLAAQLTKLAGAGGGALLAGLPRGQALQVGVLMNCRGVTELVIATIGLGHGLISPLGFTILVLIAVITSAVTGVAMRYLLRTGR
ncbi:cation:proton antiporter [Amycolatopsis sp. YIM 10]|uniref:cation:proton antiporter n=1 Tax=Amycolatopsis sp. YIM 10 TaxID=2653857 RepID=UPI0012905048|nr:cation:proton antiporter [Amycolatopsis sp. YIM 10]QFU89736.1 High-affinity Na(+)/H(+) antiporter NhaS3 [Amycolatopsis sp. YIM 10]